MPLNRRDVLKNSAITTAVFGFSGVAAASGDDRNSKSSFDPNNESEVREFLDRLREAPQEERQRLIDDLTKSQFQSVQDALRPNAYVVNGGQAGIQVASSSPPHTVSVTATSTLGFKLWTLYHEIDWQVPNADLPIDSRAWMTIHDALYTGNGISDSKGFVDEWEARKVGVVEALYNIEYKGVQAGFEFTPVVHLEGEPYGGYNIIEKEDGQ